MFFPNSAFNLLTHIGICPFILPVTYTGLERQKHGRKADINTQRLHRKESSPTTKTYRSNIFIYSEDKIISTVTKTTKLAIETKKKKYKPLKMYRIQNGMSYLAIISKTGSEMITKIQHQTAPWQSVVLLLQPKIIKPTDRR